MEEARVIRRVDSKQEVNKFVLSAILLQTSVITRGRHVGNFPED